MEKPVRLSGRGHSLVPARRHEEPLGATREQVLGLPEILLLGIAGHAQHETTRSGFHCLAGTPDDIGEDVVAGRDDHAHHEALGFAAFQGRRTVRLLVDSRRTGPDHSSVQPPQLALGSQVLHVPAQRDGRDAEFIRQRRNAQTATLLHESEHAFPALTDMNPHTSP